MRHYKWILTLGAVFMAFPDPAHALQLHASSEGIITHQIGHLFFLFSMVILMFIISGKGLDCQRGWRLIQWSALFFILWNTCAIAAHFIDNQVYAVSIEHSAEGYARIITQNDSDFLAWVYYALKLDHLLCVPAMLLLYTGLSCLVTDQRQAPREGA